MSLEFPGDNFSWLVFTPLRNSGSFGDATPIFDPVIQQAELLGEEWGRSEPV